MDFGTAQVTRYYLANGVIVASRTNSNAVIWHAADHQGTAQIVVDSTTLQGTIRKQDPFGNSRGTTPTWPDSHGFVGGANEPDGLVHLGARMYDPTTGRFISPDHILNIADPQQANGYAYADNNPTTSSDPNGLDDGNTPAHITAITLRMQVLQAQYPGALVWGATLNEHGPDLICWGCEPGKVWVWEFKSENNKSGPGALAAEIADHVAQAKESPLSADMEVEPGPTFESIGLPYEQSASNVSEPAELVTVRDADNVAGLQLYRTDEQDQDSAAAGEKHKEKEAAVVAASRAKAKAKAAGYKPPKSKPRSAGSKLKAKSNSPSRHHSSRPSRQSRGSHSRAPLDDGAVRGGSFWGDVALFAGAIFAAELVVWGAISAGAAWLGGEAAAGAGITEGYIAKGIQDAENFANSAWKTVSSWW
jgi:RHS repeat-associated protein